MKTLVVLAIAVACAIGIVAVVFVVGGMYQQELFEEYMEDSQSKGNRHVTNPNLPELDILP